MKVVIDIEANALENPTHIWLVVCKDLTDNSLHIFRNLTTDQTEKERFLSFSENVLLWVGHNLLGYDALILEQLIGFKMDVNSCLDTLIISKLVDYPRQGHSVKHYGEEFGLNKGDFKDWFSGWSQEMEDYCVRDVEITEKIYKKYLRYINDPDRADCIRTEHQFQLVVNQLHDNGFCFDKVKAEKLLEKVSKELDELDGTIRQQFLPKSKLIREVHPKLTKHGTLSRTDFRFEKEGDLSQYNGGPFSRIEFVEFNPSSHKQLIEVLTAAGWSPTDKTQSHIDTEREYNRLKRNRNRDEALDLSLKECHDKLQSMSKTGWKINEANLSTLPKTAPSSARALAKRILLEARRRTLTEWLGLVRPDTNRIHGKFYGIGAWTHRMAHQAPNTANIPNEYDTAGQVKLLGKEFRQLWRAPKGRLLVGVDAEGIQLRIFAHYIDDPEFTDALVKGKKDDKTDPHSLNQRILGSVCKSRAAAKRFIYALLLGAGLPKLTAILECSTAETEEALSRLLERYTGFALLKETNIPKDAKRGWFLGLDGRAVRIPGDTEGARRHLAMSGYLQNGEAVVMKRATLKWRQQLAHSEACLVNFVHDEWQTETPNDVSIAMQVAKMQADSLREVGEDLKLKCPLAGSYWNDDHKDYTIGTNWYQTH